jgi:Cu(I)/Ag(I) efflux system membrane fusion protein
MNPEALSRARRWLERHARTALLLALGFVLGAGTLGLRSCVATREHEVGAHAGATSAPEGAMWTCSMHPQIRETEPGQCPLCGMDLIPVSSAANGGEGDPRIVLSERARALAKLRTTTVRRQGDQSAELRLLGRVEPNESTLKTITAWTAGRIDRLHVNVTGAKVRAGQIIATLYSPEVLSAHQDLISAKRQLSRMDKSVDSARSAATLGLEAARERLRLLGVPDGDLARMENAERPTRQVDIRAPFGGTVIERIAAEGTYVSTGAALYRIANLSALWIQLDAYESDLQRLGKGQDVRVEVEAFPGEEFRGKITFIDPTLDTKRRTARVRVEIDNRDGRLRPGMFAQAVVSTETAKAGSTPLVIPSTAPLFTGRRAIVYVEEQAAEGTSYEPRTVRLGPRLGNFYPVVAGLSEGERIVMRGAFALDADLQIRGGSSMMSSPDDRDPGLFDSALEVKREDLRRLAPVVVHYLMVQRALAADDLARAQAGATQLERAAASGKLDEPADVAVAWSSIQRDLKRHALHITQANSLEQARSGFEGLSDAVAMLMQRLGNPLDETLVLAHCPMAFGSRGASWLQQGAEVDNAYFGEAMRSCGEIQMRIAPGDHLPIEVPNAGPPSQGHEGHEH